MKEKIITIFEKVYQYTPEKTYFSPGRVNIIGGHTDYNGGHVLPFCINLGLYAAVSLRDDQTVNVYSDNLPNKGIISFSLENLSYDPKRDFANYVSGVFMELIVRKFDIKHGFDIVLYGNLPRGGGLSSSAALLVLITKIISDYNHFDLDGVRMALITKTVENMYIGVSSGIMDQFIIANGKSQKAIYLNANTLDYRYVPVQTDDYKLVLINSNTTRKLTESNYNTRQTETQHALQKIQKVVPINHLCDLSIDQFEQLKILLQDETLVKRVKHVVYENIRVLKAKNALEKNDFLALGKLLVEAHESARDLYEITTERLDKMVEKALELGSLGSKMIGGGFGGSTLNIIKATELDTFLKAYTEFFVQLTNSDPVITIVEPTDGVKQLS